MESENVNTAAVTVALAVIGMIIFTFLLKSRRKRPWPVVPGYPVFGNALEVKRLSNMSACLNRWADLYGQSGLFEFSLGPSRFLVCCNNETILELSKYRPFKVRRHKGIVSATESCGACGIFAAEGDQWKADRRIVSPTLNRKHVMEYLPTVKLVTQRILEKWKNAGENRAVVAINDDTFRLAVDIITLTAYGIDINSLSDPESQYARDVRTCLDSCLTKALAYPIFPYYRIPIVGQYLDGGGWALDRMHTAFFEKIIHEYERKDKTDPNDPSRDTFLAKLYALCKEGTKIDQERFVGNLLTVFLGGTDAVASAMTTLVWKLVIIEEESGQLQEELAREAIQFGDWRDIQVDNLNEKLPRIRSFMFEVLRLYGPAPSLKFHAHEEIELLGVKIPKDTNFMIHHTYGSMHPKNPESFDLPLGPKSEKPDVFCPRRFLSSKDGKLVCTTPSNKMAGFMPFGHGPRACPGREFGEVELTVYLTALLQSFEMSLKPDHPPIKQVTKFVERPDRDVEIVFVPRQEKFVSKHNGH